jgi:YidC/Oxa1 family membrane protein insertase
MKVLKPYVAEIKAKFKDNQNAQNQAVAKLYEDANQNPLAGCFTSLAQLPIFLGLYRGVRLLALDGELQEPFLWIPSLQGPVSPPSYSGMDWLTQNWQAATGVDGGLPTPSLGWETTLAYLIMPVILVTLQSITMRALQPPMDDNMSDEEKETLEKSQGVLKFLPLMIGFFSLQVPAGLTIYWFTSNIFTLTQSLAVRAYFAANPPTINLPEYWDTALAEDADFAKMTPSERRAAAEAGIQIGPTMDELVEEAMFHTFIERTPLRFDSETWKRIEADRSKTKIASELEEWVKANSAHVNGSSSQTGASQRKLQEAENAFFVEKK